MARLRRVTRDDEDALIAFEMENRDYFAQFISDRGDQFFEKFTEQHQALMAEQDAGSSIFHVLVEDDKSVVGRVNLYDLKLGSAELGYRMSARIVGHGIATAAVQEVMALAVDEYHLTRLGAVVNDSNPASKRVLEKCGFSATGSTQLKGQPATRYELQLRLSS